MATAPVNNTFYADPKGLGALRHDARTQTPAAIKETAKQFESLFTSMLLKSMRAATPKDSLSGSDQQGFYQDMFDQQIASQIAKGKGLGLSDMLVQQLMRNSASAAAAQGATATAAPAVVAPGSQAPMATQSLATQPPTTQAWPPATKADFVQALLPAATAAGQKLGVDPQTLIAHAALETGWGKNMPRNADGSCSFNLFGIKAGSSWQGPVANSMTTEFSGGVASRESASFRSYASPEACLNDYASMLASRPRFGAALGTGSDVTAFASGLQRGGYATDPQYVSKLSAVARQMQVNSPEAIIARGLT